METYLIVLIVLIILALTDLVVGVANDAVNFLNSAIGSKVAPRHIILIVASLGVFIGTLFSSGMMEIARKGIFNPEMFNFSEVMAIFVAVMITDVLLLDFYNTFGIPTSTTVSLISSLLGGSVVISFIKIYQANKSWDLIGSYINITRVSAIFSAILFSVVISFLAGSIIQFISRLIFTFNYEKRFRRYGAIWGALAFTSITYFIFIKGAKGSSFLNDEIINWITNNTSILLGVSIVFWTVVFQLLLWFTKIDILKPIVLVGTFSLALAFAANDLVNFIGVPLAGLSAYQIAASSVNPFEINMIALRESVKANSFLLILAGFVMVGTLWFNKKARTVTKTEINLGRQFEGYEKFESSALARSIVRIGLNIGNSIKKMFPNKIWKKVNKRFDITKAEYLKYNKKDRPAFDYIRATVNLMVSSSLISLATAYKLPLSTTYVTFMVAMATSFADRSWGRDSAVYRVNGVLTVISGWIFTAFIAMTISGTLSFIIYHGGIWAIIFLLIFVMFVIIRSNLLHKKKEKKIAKIEASLIEAEKSFVDGTFKKEIEEYLNNIENIYSAIYSGLCNEKRGKLKKVLKETKELEIQGMTIINKMLYSLQYFDGNSFLHDEINSGKAVIAIADISSLLKDIAKATFDHIDNNHSALTDEQKEDFKQLRNLVSSQITLMVKANKNTSADYEDLSEKINEFKKTLKKLDKNQVQYIKKGSAKFRTNLLFLSILFKTESILNNLNEIYFFFKTLNFHKLPNK